MSFYLSLLHLPTVLSLSATDLSSIWSESCGFATLATYLPLQLLGFSAGSDRAEDPPLSAAPLTPVEQQLLGPALEGVC